MARTRLIASTYPPRAPPRQVTGREVNDRFAAELGLNGSADRVNVLGRSWSGTLVKSFCRSSDHDLGNRLGELLLKLGQHAGRGDQHQPVELVAAMLGLDLLGHERDEILLGGFMQIAAGLDGVTRSVGALLHPAGRSSPRSLERLCISAATKLNAVRKAPVSSRSTNRALPPSAMMYQIRACFMVSLPWPPGNYPGLTHAENVNGKVGKLALGERNGRHRVIGQHDMRHDRARGLPFFVGDLIEARNVGIGVLLLAVDQMAVRAEPLRQLLAVEGIRLVRHRSGKRQSRPEQQSHAKRENDAQIHGKPSLLAGYMGRLL